MPAAEEMLDGVICSREQFCFQTYPGMTHDTQLRNGVTYPSFLGSVLKGLI